MERRDARVAVESDSFDLGHTYMRDEGIFFPMLLSSLKHTQPLPRVEKIGIGMLMFT